MSQNRFEILILGTAQDGGYPHVGCTNLCCEDAWQNSYLKKYIASIALVDHMYKKYFIIDITPDFGKQLQLLYKTYSKKYQLSGIFLTHAHVGHYTGLYTLGLEMMNTNKIPVYAMPKLMDFLQTNSSTKFLFSNNNIVANELRHKKKISFFEDFSVTPFLVPHRNELSETVGYNIKSNLKSIIYIPDIDSWELWDENIIDVIKNNDILFLDGTFYNKEELQGRDIEKVPHPLVIHSMELFKNLSKENKNKIYFTHLNHTNNLLRNNSEEYRKILEKDFNILSDRQIFKL